MGRDGERRDGTGRDGTGRNGTGGTERDGTGRDGTGREIMIALFLLLVCYYDCYYLCFLYRRTKPNESIDPAQHLQLVSRHSLLGKEIRIHSELHDRLSAHLCNAPELHVHMVRMVKKNSHSFFAFLNLGFGLMKIGCRHLLAF